MKPRQDKTHTHQVQSRKIHFKSQTLCAYVYLHTPSLYRDDANAMRWVILIQRNAQLNPEINANFALWRTDEEKLLQLN